jgi:hypothetical protein
MKKETTKKVVPKKAKEFNSFPKGAKVNDYVHDPVNNPSHYTDGNIEVIDFIEDKNFNFNLGNTIRHIARAGKKNGSTLIQDLEKAQWYLNREITNLKKK